MLVTVVPVVNVEMGMEMGAQCVEEDGEAAHASNGTCIVSVVG